jgi:predicted nucleotidyltransferase
VLGHHSVEGIRKALRRLVAQGVVHAAGVGPTVAYRLNRDHIAADHIIGLARLRETFLTRLEDYLRRWEVPPVYAAVFGSAARGSMTTRSDLDLLLIRPDDTYHEIWETQVSDLVNRVATWLGNDVRPLELTAAQVVTHARGEPVLWDVAQEGLTVAGNPRWLASLLRKGAG